jgi:hypothetical protein
MTSPNVTTQWSTVEPFIDALPGWVPLEDQLRIAAYGKYEDIYWSNEEGFAEVMRGDNANPVAVPTARTVVNTLNRYTAPGFGWRVEPLVAGDGETESTAVDIARLAFEALFDREDFLAKFNANKLQGLRQGDWLWHIIGDKSKPAGRRLSLHIAQASSYFPVYDVDNPERLVKVHLAELIEDGDTQLVSRLTYTRVFDEAGNQTGITVSHGLFEIDGWHLSSSPDRVVIAEQPLPEMIPAIPVYHVANGNSTAPFGDSELRGFESVLLDVNQVMSDESMTLALDGIGIYANDGNPPVDENGDAVPYVMGPGRVLSNAKGLRRVNGTSSVTPFGDHYERLIQSLHAAVGAGDVALGKSGSAASSGIALLLELGPILSHTAPLDQRIIGKHRQMFYDLCFWLQEYEELPLIGTSEGNVPTPLVRVEPTIGPKIPVNRAEIIKEVVDLRSLVPPVISVQTAHTMLKSVGIPIVGNEVALLVAEQAAALSGQIGETEDADASARTDQEFV